MAEKMQLICASNVLRDGGKGVRFICEAEERTHPAFVIRYQGKIHAYLNRCAHMGLELDWMEGEFFDDSGVYLICASHGATYQPATGFCVAGPCRGASLERLAVEEKNGKVYFLTKGLKHGG
ncbi:MAG: Rieske (2Fe-2S) protein [Burkholderiales bacterium]